MKPFKNHLASVAAVLVSLSLAFSLNAKPVDAQLSAKEQAIVAQLEQSLPRDLKHLEHIVNINSGTMNFAGVKDVGMYLKSEFDAIGFETQWLDGKAFNRAGHLVATYHANKPNAKKVLLIGHLDTVFAPEDDFQRYQKISESEVSGPGVADMKGGNIIILALAKVLKAEGVLDNISLQVVMTGDEEKSGRPLSASKKVLIDGAKWADVALGFEDGDGNVTTAVTARRGAIGWTLEVTAKSAHSSQIFRDDIGAGAIYESARILNSFREQLGDEPNLTFNPGSIVAGTRTSFDNKASTGTVFGKSNVIAKTALIKGDIRAISAQQLAKTKQVMTAIVADNLPHTKATIVFSDGYPALTPTQGNADLLELYSKVSQDLGYGKVTAVDPRKAGAADISFTSGYVDMALDGLGLMGRGSHTKDEVAELDTFAQNSQKAALLIYRLSQQ